ncbi:MAG: NAD(P)-binding protein [Vampirovibrionales bacterium]|nr:NAD(P)-binding protein [Vampirovibrionales bacterium]
MVIYPSFLTPKPVTVAIVGAGIAGLLLGQQLQDLGHSVVLLDKGRSVGGRLATRRGVLDTEDDLSKVQMPIRWDHGAQYFSAHSLAFQQIVTTWQTQGWIKEWEEVSIPNHPRWIANDGMSALCKHLATPLTVFCNQQVTVLSYQQGLWTLQTDSNQSLQAHHVVLTAPTPQVLNLLQQSDLALTDHQNMVLQSIQYSPCLAMLGLVSNKSFLPSSLAEGFLRLNDHPSISWMANNTAKGISNAASQSLTIHATAAWSQQHWDDSDVAILSSLTKELAPFITRETWQQTQLKRWKYALVTQAASEAFTSLTTHPNLWAAGDGFVSGKVEGSVSSILALSKTLGKELNSALSKGPLTL